MTAAGAMPAGAMPAGAGDAGEPIDDRELLVRVQGGDTGAFDALVQRYLPRARALARRLMQMPPYRHRTHAKHAGHLFG